MELDRCNVLAKYVNLIGDTGLIPWWIESWIIFNVTPGAEAGFIY
jgi:hypothetical protein